MGFIFYKFAYLDLATCLLYWVYAMTYYVINGRQQRWAGGAVAPPGFSNMVQIY